jgi:phenylacetate-CoA ligase
MVLDEDVMLEIVHPAAATRGAGEVGEVVVTVFNPDYPLIRFATGDLSAVLTDAPDRLRPHQYPHQGLDGARRPDHQGARHVRPSVAGACDRAPPSGDRKARLVVSGRWRRMMTLHCEVDDPHTGSARRHHRTIRELTKLRGEVEFVAVGSLPNDGKVIDDMRDYK